MTHVTIITAAGLRAFSRHHRDNPPCEVTVQPDDGVYNLPLGEWSVVSDPTSEGGAQGVAL